MTGYWILEVGDVIREGDEILIDEEGPGNWNAVLYHGLPIVDPDSVLRRKMSQEEIDIVTGVLKFKEVNPRKITL